MLKQHLATQPEHLAGRERGIERPAELMTQLLEGTLAVGRHADTDARQPACTHGRIWTGRF